MYQSRYAVLALTALVVAVAGCRSMPAEISARENLLANAGFIAVPANTPERLLDLETLPANTMILHVDPGIGNSEYIYADPVECHCLYIGDQQAFDTYLSEIRKDRPMNEEQAAQQRYPGDWDWSNWDWGHWGGGLKGQ